MRKAKGKATRQSGKGAGSAGSRKQVDLEALRQRIANYVGSKGFQMVKTATEDTMKVANLSSMKYLFEMIGLYPPAATPCAEETDSDDLARVLLNRLKVGKGSGVENTEAEAAAAVRSDSVE
jgi:hypothetical protein